MNKIYQTIILIGLSLALLLNINWLKSTELGLILGLAYFIIFGYILGSLLFKQNKISWQLIFGSFSLLSAYSFLGAIIYYIYKLDQLVISLLFVLISGIIIYFNFKQGKDLKLNLSCPTKKLTTCILSATYLILIAVLFYILWQSQTVEVINSPWQIISPAFLLIYFISTLNLIFLLFYNKNIKSSIFLAIHFFLTTTIALIVYKLGYGFDPFIHQATEKEIFNQGFILPKPLYYLGQYSIVIFLGHLFQVSVELIDKLLLPVLLSIFLPYTMYISLHKTFSWPKNICRVLSLSLLFIPFSLFIVTNPQAIANLFTIIILFLSFIYLKDRQIPFYYLVFLTLTTIGIHPLSGIPVLIYLIIVWLLANNGKIQKIILPIFIAGATLALPLALILNSIVSIYKININRPEINLIFSNIFNKQFNFFLDLAYIYKNSIYWLFLIIAILVIIYLFKQKNLKIFLSSILTFIILLANSLLLKFINVSSIIDYEQDFFSQRVMELAFYFILPLVIYGLYLFITKFNKIYIIFIFAAFLTCSVYLSYPRYDDYDDSKFINLSQTDIEITEFIEQNAQTDYIVLTNQMTSAAAVKKFGFTRYYNGFYFYPIPTGGELYQYYLDMLKNPNNKTMTKAMELTNTEQAYFVLPIYWNDFERLSEKAKKDAFGVYSLEDKVYIYKYSK